MARRAAYDDKRMTIVRAALRTLQDEGYDAVTVDRVIDAAKISKGTFYHYFPSKDALVEAALVEVVNEVVGDLLARPSDAPAEPETTDQEPRSGATGRLATILDLVRPWAHGDGAANRALAGALLSTRELEGQRTRMFAILTRRLTPVVTEVIDDGVREGVFRVADPPVTAELIVLLALSTRARVIAPATTGPDEAAKWLDGFLTVVERALGLPDRVFSRESNETMGWRKNT